MRPQAVSVIAVERVYDGWQHSLWRKIIASLRLPEKDNELVWEVSMKSHPDSLCEGLMWSLVFDFRDTRYPFEPPKVTIHSPLNRLLKKAYVVSSSSSHSLASQHAMANSYHTVRGICTCVR